MVKQSQSKNPRKTQISPGHNIVELRGLWGSFTPPFLFIDYTTDMKLPRKILDEDGEVLYYCSAHEGYSPREAFGSLTGSDKPRGKCRKCESEYTKLRNQGKLPIKKKTDKQLAEEILTDLGYQLDSEVPLWVQFMMKHEMVGRKLSESTRILSKE